MRCMIKDCPNEAMADKLRCRDHSESSSSGAFAAVQSPSTNPPPFSVSSVPVHSMSDQELSDLLGRVSQELAVRNRKKIPGSAEAVKKVQEIVAKAVGRKDPRED